jgi:cellulose 1,4-beta-cellobiosidase
MTTTRPIRWLLASAALWVIACNLPKRPEGGSSLQIKPDVHNLFRDATFYVSPRWTDEIAVAAALVPDGAKLLGPVGSQPVALWIDRVELARTEVAKWVDFAQTGLVVVVIHDLPNRGCSRGAASELTLADEARYQTEVIDSVAASITTRTFRRVAIILEPDSLANLVTHPNVAACASADGVYRRSIAYAISKLSMSGVAIYLDAGNADSLGSDANREKIATIFKDVLDHAGGADKIRGFATNVAGYSAIADELRYTHKLAANLVSVGILDKFFVIDTSRNGRKNGASFCNVRGAGLGERPRSSPSPGVDAYFWLKVPTESDGPCASEDAAPQPPPAGMVFPSYFAELVRLANPPYLSPVAQR